MHTYTADDQPGINSRGYQLTQEEATKRLDQNTTWQKEVGLRVGAIVMLITVRAFSYLYRRC
jgi:hypothetical protein